MQSGKTFQVLDLLDVTFAAHASVEAVVGTSQADDARDRLAAEDGSGGGCVRCGTGQEEELAGRLATYGLLGQGELDWVGRGDGQCGIELGDVVRCVDGVKSSFSLGVARCEAWRGGEEI